MSDWRETSIDTLGVVTGGGTPSRDRPEYWDGSIRWLTPGELTNFTGKRVFETRDHLTDAGLSASGARLVPADTLLVTSRATLGSCALAGAFLATNQGFKNLTCGVEADPDFMFFLMETLQRELIRRASGTTFLEISAKEFKRIEIHLPPLEEQRRIAKVLDTIDETIQATASVIAKLEAMRDGTRLSRFAGLMESSAQRPVAECFGMTLGKMLSPAATVGASPAPYLANRNVQWEACRLDDLDVMDFSLRDRRRLRLQPGDVLVCEGGEVGRTAVWRGELENCFFQKAIHRLRSNGAVLPDFMLGFMRYASDVDLFRRFTSQTSIAHLTGEQLARLPMPVPPVAVQQQVVGELQLIGNRIRAEHQEAQKLQATRSGLALDLLSGRVRTVAA